MKKDLEIVQGIYIIGGPNISHSSDAAVFIIDFGGELVMIDSGAGSSYNTILENIGDLGFDPNKISTIILTHCHIDHIGSAPYFKADFNCKLIAHRLDAGPIEKGDPTLTGADLYGLNFPPTKVDRKLTGDHEILRFGDEEIHCIHTPGHTPGSISLFVDRDKKKVLFGQDIHGPFLPAFGSDIEEWKKSMKKLLDLEADILCEGHFGIYRSKEKVRGYIMSYLNRY